MRVLVFGNPLLPEDRLPLKLLPKLRKKFPKIDFVESDPDELEVESAKGLLTIIDTVKGIKKVTILTEKDIDKFEISSKYTVHDFDLGWTLKILRKMGLVNDVGIIGVPSGMNEAEALKEVVGSLSSILGSPRKAQRKGRRRTPELFLLSELPKGAARQGRHWA